MFVSETYSIEDCIKAWDTTLTSQITPNYQLPSNWKIQFIINSNDYSSSTGSRTNAPFIRFDSSSGGYIGKGSSASRIITVSPISKTLNNIPVSTDVEYTVTKNGNTLTASDGTSTVSGSTSNCNKLYLISASSDGNVKKVRIKPL